MYVFIFKKYGILTRFKIKVSYTCQFLHIHHEHEYYFQAFIKLDVIMEPESASTVTVLEFDKHEAKLPNKGKVQQLQESG